MLPYLGLAVSKILAGNKARSLLNSHDTFLKKKMWFNSAILLRLTIFTVSIKNNDNEQSMANKIFL